MPAYRVLLYCALVASTLLLDSRTSAPAHGTASTAAFLVPTNMAALKALPPAAQALRAADARPSPLSAAQQTARVLPTALVVSSPRGAARTSDATSSCPATGRSTCRSVASLHCSSSKQMTAVAAAALALGAALGRTAGLNSSSAPELKPQEQPEQSAMCLADDPFASNDSSACEATQQWLREDKRLARVRKGE